MRALKRYAMSLSALALAVLGATVTAGPRDAVAWGLASMLGAWFAVELWIAARQTFHDVVPRSRWVLASRILWIAGVAFLGLDVKFAILPLAVPRAVKGAALVVIAGGIVLRALASFQLGRFFTYDLRVASGQKLKTTGLYRFIRHPSYLALCILGCVPALAMGSVGGFLILGLFTVPQIVHRVGEEERMLERTFGEEFAAYRKKTFRLLPFLY